MREKIVKNLKYIDNTNFIISMTVRLHNCQK